MWPGSANASQVEIELKIEKKNLYLIMNDNGDGITEEQKNASPSLGIMGMRERTHFLGGDVKIEGTKKEENYSYVANAAKWGLITLIWL